MAIKFINIRHLIDGKPEVAVADTEPKIAALWATSDHSPNITQGQDMGWRLAPEVVIELKKIKQDFQKLDHIGRLFNKMAEEVNESDILTYISNKTSLEEAPIADVSDYQDEYDDQVRALERQHQAEVAAANEPAPTTTTTTTEAPTTTTTTTQAE